MTGAVRPHRLQNFTGSTGANLLRIISAHVADDTGKPTLQFNARKTPASSVIGIHVVTITLHPALYHDRSRSLHSLPASNYGSECSVDSAPISGFGFKNSYSNKLYLFTTPKQNKPYLFG